MAENCPTSCPNILECERRIEGLAVAEVTLLKQKSILDSVQAAEALAPIKLINGRIELVDSNLRAERRDWSNDVSDELRSNSRRLVRAQAAAPEVHAAQDGCETGPRPSLLGHLAVWNEIIFHGKKPTEADKAAILRRNPRYMKCGNPAAKAALRNVPKPN